MIATVKIGGIFDRFGKDKIHIEQGREVTGSDTEEDGVLSRIRLAESILTLVDSVTGKRFLLGQKEGF